MNTDMHTAERRKSCHGSEATPGGPTPSSPVDETRQHAVTSTALPSPPPRTLLEPIEAGGLDMTALTEALKADASEQEGLVQIVGRVLDTIVRHNDQQEAKVDRARPDTTSMLPLFEDADSCPLCPSAYLKRMMKYTACSPCNLVVALVYLQRLKDSDTDQAFSQGLRLTSHNLQRLLLTALLLASKFLDEPYASNKQWALVGDLSTKEMNALELEMLWCLKFSLSISREEYDTCHLALIELDTTTHIVSTSSAVSQRRPAPPAASATGSKQGGCTAEVKHAEAHATNTEPHGPATPTRTKLASPSSTFTCTSSSPTSSTVTEYRTERPKDNVESTRQLARLFEEV